MPFTPKKIESLADYEAMGPGTVFAAMKVKVEAVDDTSMTISMPVTDKVKQPFGLLHGGITMFLIESASSMHACWGVDLTKRVPPFPTRWQHLMATFSGPRVDDSRWRHLRRFVLPVPWIEAAWRD